MTLEDLKGWLKNICEGLGSCLGMIEIDAGEAAGRPCALCESTSDTSSAVAIKRSNPVSILGILCFTVIIHYQPVVGHCWT